MLGNILLILLFITAIGVLIACICVFGDVVLTLLWSFLSLLFIPILTVIFVCLVITLIVELLK